MSDNSDSEYGDTGKAVEEAAAAVLGEGGDATSSSSAPFGGADEETPDVLPEIGEAVARVFDYQHDVEEDPPERSGPYPAGGPH